MLNANKRIAMEVKEKVAIAEETKHKIGTAREEYRPVAIRGSIIYFLMSEIAVCFSLPFKFLNTLHSLAGQSYVSDILTAISRSFPRVDVEVIEHRFRPSLTSIFLQIQ